LPKVSDLFAYRRIALRRGAAIQSQTLLCDVASSGPVRKEFGKGCAEAVHPVLHAAAYGELESGKNIPRFSWWRARLLASWYPASQPILPRRSRSPQSTTLAAPCRSFKGDTVSLYNPFYDWL